MDGSESARPGKHGKPNSGKRQMAVGNVILLGLCLKTEALKYKIKW